MKVNKEVLKCAYLLEPQSVKLKVNEEVPQPASLIEPQRGLLERWRGSRNSVSPTISMSDVVCQSGNCRIDLTPRTRMRF